MLTKGSGKVILRFFSLLFIISFFYLSVFSQTGKSAYSKTKFAEGVYFKPQDFIAQTPSLLKDNLLSGNIKANSIRSWTKSDSLFFKNSAGIKSSMRIDEIWGICENGDLYIVHNGSIHKLNTLGAISVFNETYALAKAPNAPVAMDQNKEVKQYFSDLTTGQVYEYNTESFKTFLQLKDPALYEQFMAYKSNKKRREMMYHCIEVYNDKHVVL